MKNTFLFFFGLMLCLFVACSGETNSSSSEESTESESAAAPKKEMKPAPHIVFVTGDEEYRSEESMPMLGRILEREMNAKISVCYSMGEDGFIDPNNTKDITGLEALETADLMVMFTRFRALPDEQLEKILAYAESGKPMVGFRTATHAFMYKNDLEKGDYNEKWPIKVFGQKWITHHGHFDDGQGRLTEVNLYSNQKTHPVLKGFQPFKAYSWLYHVEGNGHQLSGDSAPLMTGRSLRSNYAESAEYPMNNPVAWTKTYTGTSGTAARVFFTTLGHPFDFKEVSMRKVAINGIAWALSREEDIPDGGFNVDFVGAYEPNNSGFGEKFKKNLKPAVFN